MPARRRTTRSPSFPMVTIAIGVMGSGIAAVCSTLLASACADDALDTSSDAAAAPVVPDAQRPPPDDAGTVTLTCKAACDEDHALGLVKDRALLECWEAQCKTPCIDGAREDAGAGRRNDAGGAPSCGTAVVTANAACTVCTRESCCVVWDACFRDPDCTALNACYQACAR